MKKMLPLFLILLLLLTSCGKTLSSTNNGISGLPEGEFLEAHHSLNGEYTINIYLCGGGATTDYSIRGELLTNTTGTRKNIYWNYHEDDAVVQWISDETVIINNHIINIHDDVYDFRWDY